MTQKMLFGYYLMNIWGDIIKSKNFKSYRKGIQSYRYKYFSLIDIDISNYKLCQNKNN